MEILPLHKTTKSLGIRISNLHSVTTEAFMFALAALVYVLFAGGFSSVPIFGRRRPNEIPQHGYDS